MTFDINSKPKGKSRASKTEDKIVNLMGKIVDNNNVREEEIHIRREDIAIKRGLLDIREEREKDHKVQCRVETLRTLQTGLNDVYQQKRQLVDDVIENTNIASIQDAKDLKEKIKKFREQDKRKKQKKATIKTFLMTIATRKSLKVRWFDKLLNWMKLSIY